MNDIMISAIASICHEANCRYCNTIGDLSQQSWEYAPAWQRQSAINGVKFHLDNPGAMPADSHNNWLKEKEAAGWKYGPVKDPEKKEHPCMVPYAELSKSQRVKDMLFMNIVETFRKGM